MKEEKQLVKVKFDDLVETTSELTGMEKEDVDLAMFGINQAIMQKIEENAKELAKDKIRLEITTPICMLGFEYQEPYKNEEGLSIVRGVTVSTHVATPYLMKANKELKNMPSFLKSNEDELDKVIDKLGKEFENKVLAKEQSMKDVA